jgi:Protein of unknown function (DUF2950)
MMDQAQKIVRLRPKILGGAVFLGAGLAFGAMAPAALAQSAPAAATYSLAADQQSFPTAQAAVDALVKALQANDKKSLMEIFGPSGDKMVSSGDKVADDEIAANFVKLYNQSHTLTPQPDGSVTLVIGDNGWPMPIPLVQADGKWQFDTVIGAQDIVDRRIGRNELLTIQTLLSVVDAQEDFFSRTKDADGTGVYAQRMISTPGQEDGLYWEAAEGQAESPLGPLIDQAENEGYPVVSQSGGHVRTAYHGYYFHALKAQGPDAPGGAANYLVDGKMTGGFAFVAWPASYESSGVMTFVVDQDGIVFQKDLGPDTAEIASQMTLFNPDMSWARVDISN